MGRYRKAIGTAIGAVLTVVTFGLITGEFNRTELAAAVIGLQSTLLTWLFGNDDGPHDETGETSPDDDGQTTLGTRVAEVEW